MAHFDQDEEDEYNFIDSEIDDESIPASERNATSIKDLKQSSRKEESMTFNLNQQSIIKTLQDDLELKQQDLRNFMLSINKMPRALRMSMQNGISSLDSISEFMPLAIDGLKVLQLDIVQIQEQLKDEQLKSEELLRQLKQVDREKIEMQEDILLQSSTIRRLQSEVSRLNKVNDLREKTYQKQQQFHSPSQTILSSQSTDPPSDQSNGPQKKIFENLYNQNNNIQEEIKKLSFKLNTIQNAPQAVKPKVGISSACKEKLNVNEEEMVLLFNAMTKQLKNNPNFNTNTLLCTKQVTINSVEKDFLFKRYGSLLTTVMKCLVCLLQVDHQKLAESQIRLVESSASVNSNIMDELSIESTRGDIIASQPNKTQQKSNCSDGSFHNVSVPTFRGQSISENSPNIQKHQARIAESQQKRMISETPDFVQIPSSHQQNQDQTAKPKEIKKSHSHSLKTSVDRRKSSHSSSIKILNKSNLNVENIPVSQRQTNLSSRPANRRLTENSVNSQLLDTIAQMGKSRESMHTYNKKDTATSSILQESSTSKESASTPQRDLFKKRRNQTNNTCSKTANTFTSPSTNKSNNNSCSQSKTVTNNESTICKQTSVERSAKLFDYRSPDKLYRVPILAKEYKPLKQRQCSTNVVSQTQTAREISARDIVPSSWGNLKGNILLYQDPSTSSIDQSKQNSYRSTGMSDRDKPDQAKQKVIMRKAIQNHTKNQALISSFSESLLQQNTNPESDR